MKKKIPPPAITIEGCVFHGATIPTPSDKMLEAVKAIADASAAHARALAQCAEHLAGPTVNSTGLSIRDGRVE